ncbi:MAG: hypothetical protein IJO46_12640 [Thermoguttaceae bacterium]|nr:hypothetical protein [Thermoguttaceae bacterium]
MPSDRVAVDANEAEKTVVTVAELAVAFLSDKKDYYVKDGANAIRSATRKTSASPTLAPFARRRRKRRRSAPIAAVSFSNAAQVLAPPVDKPAKSDKIYKKKAFPFGASVSTRRTQRL